MVKRCVVCSKFSQDNVSVHKFPEEKKVRCLWVKFVQQTRKYWQDGDSPYICSEHFLATDFLNYMKFQCGFASKLILKKDAVPTLYPKKIGSENVEKENPRSAFRKREADRLLQQSFTETSNDNDLANCTDINESVSNPMAQKYVSVGVQCEIITNSVAIQVEPLTKERAVLVKPSLKIKGTQTEKYDKESNKIEQTPKKPKKRKCNASYFHTPEKISIMDSPQKDDIKNDPTFDPRIHTERDEICGLDIHESEYIETALYKEKKYIVNKSKLWELLEACSVCGQSCSVKIINQIGTYIKVQTKCSSCDLSNTWESQPFVKNIPITNMQLSAAILFSGSSRTKVLRILDYMNIASISKATFDNHLTKYLEPTIVTMWSAQQMDLFEELKQMHGGLVLGGDSRCDSPGHSAKYGSYTMIELRMNKIIDLQLVQSNEAKGGSSCNMEIEGFIKSFELLDREGLNVDTLITDRHKQVKKQADIYISEGKLTRKYDDCWHTVKGNTKKVTALRKLKDCQDVKPWIKSISNHLYWCASSSSGNGELAAAKWISIVNHIQNIHEHENPLFEKCLHAQIQRTQKKWLTRGSKAMVKLEDLLLNKNLIEDVKRMSPVYQTYNVEGYHSLVLQFAPKNQNYSYKGMLVRLLLSVLHYNENSNRRRATDDEGMPKYKVIYPKSKKGKYSVQQLKVSATFGYVDELMELLFNNVIPNPAPYRVQLENTNIPAPLASQYYHPTKEEVKQTYTSRFPSKK